MRRCVLQAAAPSGLAAPRQRRQAAAAAAARPSPTLARQLRAAALPHPSYTWKPLQCRQRPVAAAAAAAAASPAAAAGNPSAAQQAPPPPAATSAAAWRLAVSTLRPDWPLLLGTFIVLAGTVLFTLLFPLAIGEVFDVVRQQVRHSRQRARTVCMRTAASRQHLCAGIRRRPRRRCCTARPGAHPHVLLQGGLAGTGGGATPGAVNPFAGLGGAVVGTPSSFRAAMVKLSVYQVLSATGNALVSYFSTVLAERFAYRLKERLMRTIMAQDTPFFDATTQGDLVSRLTVDVQVLQATLAGARGAPPGRGMIATQGRPAAALARRLTPHSVRPPPPPLPPKPCADFIGQRGESAPAS